MINSFREYPHPKTVVFVVWRILNSSAAPAFSRHPTATHHNRSAIFHRGKLRTVIHGTDAARALIAGDSPIIRDQQCKAADLSRRRCAGSTKNFLDARPHFW